jgi:hypothetical protein
MRFLVKATVPVEVGNAAIKDGSLMEKIQSIVAETHPECAYFTALNGERCAWFVLNIDEPYQIPHIAEPFFLGLNCNVEMVPVMVAEDLARASEAFPRIIETYA